MSASLKTNKMSSKYLPHKGITYTLRGVVGSQQWYENASMEYDSTDVSIKLVNNDGGIWDVIFCIYKNLTYDMEQKLAKVILQGQMNGIKTSGKLHTYNPFPRGCSITIDGKKTESLPIFKTEDEIMRYLMKSIETAFPVSEKTNEWDGLKYKLRYIKGKPVSDSIEDMKKDEEDISITYAVTGSKEHPVEVAIVRKSKDIFDNTKFFRLVNVIIRNNSISTEIKGDIAVAKFASDEMKKQMSKAKPLPNFETNSEVIDYLQLSIQESFPENDWRLTTIPDANIRSFKNRFPGWDYEPYE